MNMVIKIFALLVKTYIMHNILKLFNCLRGKLKDVTFYLRVCCLMKLV